MARKKSEINLNNKPLVVVELTMFDYISLKPDICNIAQATGSVETGSVDIRNLIKTIFDIKTAQSAFNILKKAIPELEKDDLLHSCPSELYEAFEVIKNVNFTTFEKIMAGIVSIFTEEKLEDVIRKLFKLFWDYTSERIPISNSTPLDIIDENSEN